MKLKGVNPIEQHIEKIVLVAVSAIFLVVLAAQFLFEPNKVKVGNAEPVPPGKALHAAEDLAHRLKNRMEATDFQPPAVPRLDLVNQFKSRMQGAVSPRPTLDVAMGPAPQIQTVVNQVVEHPGDRPYKALEVPAPTQVAVAAYSSTIDPTEPLNVPELKSLLPAAQPMDKHAVTVEARFDGTALKTSLTADGGSTAAPIPASWWRDGMEIMSVRLERQEQTGPDQWGDPVEVTPAPGRANLGTQLKGVHSTAELSDLVAEARSEMDDIIRPPYYRTIAGEKWVAPSAATTATAGGGGKQTGAGAQVTRLVREYTDQEKSEENVKKTRATTESAPIRQTTGGGGGGGGGGGKGGAGAGGGEGGPQQGSMTQVEKDRRLKELDRRIQGIEDKKKKIEEDLRALGFDTTGKPLPENPAPVNPTNQPATEHAGKALLENDSVQLWAHDLTVAPGKTYRYRVSVGLSNPAFGRTSALTTEQQGMAKDPIVLSQASDWSQPVHVLDDQYYFITGAAEGDEVNQFQPRATAEIFRFFYGYYRKATVSLAPGDVVAASIKLPDPAKLPVYDLTALPANQPNAPVTQPGTPSAPFQRDRMKQLPQQGGGKFGSQPIQGEGERGTAAQQQEANKVTLPPNAKPWPSRDIAAKSDVMLLDVARAPGAANGGGPAAQAFLRDTDGEILVRLPEDDHKDQIYAVVNQSAREGENQGQPTAPAVAEPDKNQTPGAPRTPNAPAPMSPKGRPPAGPGGG
jgi:hypothetical protein